MQLFGSLWWDGAQDCFMGLRGGGGVEKHCTRASLRSDTVEDLIRLSVEGPSLEDVDARESVVRVAEAKDQEGQTTGVGHSRGM